MPLPSRRVRNLVIVAFLLRGAFYCVEQPLWEGFDEWAHFGYVESIARYGRLPARSDPVPDDLRRSFELVPVSASAAASPTGSATHDEYWRLPASERLSRERELRTLGPSYRSASGGGPLLQYEAQQPPLYYLLLTGPYLAVKGWSLPAQALALRLASLLIAAAGLLLCYRLAARLPACRRAALPILILLTAWPGLMVDVCRLGNDGLALTLSATAILCAFRILRRGSGLREWLWAGAALGAALLTKSYLLALLPLLPLTAIMQALRRRMSVRHATAGCLLALATAAAVSGWWYARQWLATGTLSGEALDAAAARFGVAGKLAAVWQIKWFRVLDSAAITHIWTGGWSFLGVRSWMYRVFEAAAALAAAGLVVLGLRLVRKARRRGRLSDGDAQVFIAACAYAMFGLGLAYFAIVVYLTRGISTALGWYLFGIAGAEAALLGCGFAGLAGMRRAAACVAAVAALACALDLYTVHFVSAPYYTGLVAHLPSGFLATFHLADLRGVGLAGVFERIAVNKPAVIGPAAVAALWIGYLCGTGVLMACAAATVVNSVKRPRAARPERTLRARA